MGFLSGFSKAVLKLAEPLNYGLLAHFPLFYATVLLPRVSEISNNFILKDFGPFYVQVEIRKVKKIAVNEYLISNRL